VRFRSTERGGGALRLTDRGTRRESRQDRACIHVVVVAGGGGTAVVSGVVGWVARIHGGRGGGSKQTEGYIKRAGTGKGKQMMI
jgi:hypothetical protein